MGQYKGTSKVHAKIELKHKANLVQNIFEILASFYNMHFPCSF